MKLEPWIIGKTFNDFSFRLQEGKAEHRGEIGLETMFSKHIPLNFPIVSSNMDTVTEARMSIAVAKFGGIGIIHRKVAIEKQAREVKKVKRAENLIIENPYKLLETDTIDEARKLMEEKGVGTIVVVNEKNQLRGILTRLDIVFCDNDRAPLKERMTSVEDERFCFHEGNISSIKEAKKILDTPPRVKKLPLVDDDFTLTGLITAKDIEELIKHPFANKDSKGQLRVGAAIGVVGDFLERADELIRAGVDVLVMDIAHGHSVGMKKGIEAFRDKFGGFELVCGNIATSKGALFLKELGVDGVKVGVGPGSRCRTRIETGAGVPQLQAIREAYCALEDTPPVIADGGIKQNKDIWFSVVSGASSVMLGGMLSGTDESPGNIITDPASGQKFKIYRGMTSPEAKLEGGESFEDIRTPHFIEGQEEKVLYRGSVYEILQEIKDSLQSSISYTGEKTLQDARNKIVKNLSNFFITLSRAAQEESYER